MTRTAKLFSSISTSLALQKPNSFLDSPVSNSSPELRWGYLYKLFCRKFSQVSNPPSPHYHTTRTWPTPCEAFYAPAIHVQDVKSYICKCEFVTSGNHHGLITGEGTREKEFTTRNFIGFNYYFHCRDTYTGP